jgi:membrane-anchored glycerophosphoryl diester phosphodiesterase (GDPDase)
MGEKLVYSDIFRKARKGLISQFWLLAGLVIGFTIVYSLLYLFALPAKGESMTISGITVSVLCWLLLCLFRLGYMKNCFQTLDGEEPQFSSYGQVSRKLPGYLVASVIFTLIVAIGTVLLIVPGVYLALRLQFFFASMVDENTGIIASFKRSWEITKGHTFRLFVMLLIMLLISIIGQLAFLIGIFAAIPLIVLMYGDIFRRLTAPTAS